jgi:hypothetical protein
VATGEPALSEREGRPGTDRGRPSPEDLNRSISRAAETIETIIDAAERLASEIRADAQVEAERYLDEAQREADRLAMKRIAMMSELTESLIERADDLRRRTDEVVRALEDAMRTVAATVSDRSPIDAERSAEAPEGDRLGPGASRTGAPGEDGGNAPDSATLRAAQLAIGGSGRDEISAILGREYGLTNPTPILDRLLGPSG